MPDPIIRSARTPDAPALSKLAAPTFPGDWSPDYWLAQLGEPLSHIFVAEQDAGEITGYVLARRVVDEAEILSIAVSPAHRRRGIASSLLDHLEADLRLTPPCRVFLEVSVENAPAIAFYTSLGFVEVGTRKGYYPQPGGPPIDASILERAIV